MNSPYRHNLIFLVLTLLMCTVTSCYKDIDLDEYRNAAGRDLLTLNSLLTPDSVIMVSAKETFFYSDIHNAPAFVKDLDIRLSINGESKGSLTYDHKKNLYLSNIKPQEGDIIEISTQYKGKEVSAKDIMPRQIAIDDVEMKISEPHYTSWGMEVRTFTYRIKFKDTPNSTDHYFLNCVAPQFTLVDGERVPNVTWGQYNFSHNLVFQKLEQQLGDVPTDWIEGNFYSGLPFSDDGIDGQEHTLVIEEDVDCWQLYQGRKFEREIRLYQISEPYFEYLLSCLRYDASSDGDPSGMINLGLADPMRVYTNIGNGVGILGTYTLSRRILHNTIP